MSRDEERALLSELLLRLDLSEVPMDKLVTAMKTAMEDRDERREFVGKAAAALASHGVTYARISEATGIPPSTLHLWVRLYS